MPIDDIPEARRDQPSVQYSNQGSPLFWLIGAAVSLSLGFILWLTFRPPSPTATNSPTTAQTEGETAELAGEVPESPAASSNDATGTASQTDEDGDVDGLNSAELEDTDTLLGHAAYEEAPPDSLVFLTADGRIQLREAAADKFIEMMDAALADGVEIAPVSGFRTLTDQEYLFFDVKANRVETASERAEVSAPPGYSEHHTGYAIDIVDPTRPEADLETIFEKTPAFEWMEENAARYGFELSFPRGNPQGVNYEPWHWRFVGDRDSLETFYKNKSQTSDQDAETLEGRELDNQELDRQELNDPELDSQEDDR